MIIKNNILKNNILKSKCWIKPIKIIDLYYNIKINETIL